MLLKVKLGWTHALAAGYLWSDDVAADIAAADGLVREVLAESNLTPQVRRLAQWLYATVLMMQSHLDAALIEARRAVEMAPNDAFVLCALADQMVWSGETELSAAWLDKPAALDPGQDALHRRTRGYLFVAQGHYEEALAEFARAEPLPSVYEAARAVALMRLGRIDDAKTAIRAARVGNPDLSLSKWGSLSTNPEPGFVDAELADLAAAGLPE